MLTTIHTKILKVCDSNYLLLLSFITLSVLFRLPSFFPLVIDHDESTYLVIAQKWLQGSVMYQDVVDIKPVGIYTIFAFFQLLGLKSVFLLRFLSAMFIGLGCYALYKLTFSFTKDKISSLLAGFTLLFLHLSFFALSINTETYFTIISLLGIAFIIIKRETFNWLAYAFGGFLLGLAFITKYLALLDGVAVGLYLLIIQPRQEKVKSIISISLGFIIPFIIVNLAFYIFDNYDRFYFVTFEAPFNYRSHATQPFFELISKIITYFWPLLILFFLSKKDKSFFFSILWLFLALLAVLLPQKPFEHYWIQLFAPISLVFGLSLNGLFNIDFQNNINLKWRKKMVLFRNPKSKVLIIIMLFGFMFHSLLKQIQKFSQEDEKKIVLSYLESQMKKDETVFCANYEQILYYLLDKPVLTPYVHKSILYNESHQKTLNISGKEELMKVVKKTPDYITVRDHYPVAWFDDYIKLNYDIEKEFGEVKIYKRR